jgi:hypothetical protein
MDEIEAERANCSTLSRGVVVLLRKPGLCQPQRLDHVDSLEELVDAHTSFLADLEHQSGKASVGPGLNAAGSAGGGAAGTWRHLVNAIIKILDQVGCMLAMCDSIAFDCLGEVMQ